MQTIVGLRKLLKENATHCHYCDVSFENSPTYGNDINARTIDHIVPLIRGGDKKHISNMVVCCKWCNVIKSNANYYDFVAFIAFLRKRNPNFTIDRYAQGRKPYIGKWIRRWEKETGNTLHQPFVTARGTVRRPFYSDRQLTRAMILVEQPIGANLVHLPVPALQ